MSFFNTAPSSTVAAAEELRGGEVAGGQASAEEPMATRVRSRQFCQGKERG